MLILQLYAAQGGTCAAEESDMLVGSWLRPNQSSKMTDLDSSGGETHSSDEMTAFLYVCWLDSCLLTRKPS